MSRSWGPGSALPRSGPQSLHPETSRWPHGYTLLPPTKVMAEGEGDLGWMMEEEEDEPFLWPRDQPQQWVVVHPVNLF